MPYVIPAGQKRPIPTTRGKCQVLIINPNPVGGNLILSIPSGMNQSEIQISYSSDPQMNMTILDLNNADEYCCAFNDADPNLQNVPITLDFIKVSIESVTKVIQ